MARSAMRLRILPRFPVKIQGTTGIAVDRTGGVVTVRQDWKDIQPGVGPFEQDDYEVMARDPATGAFSRLPLSASRSAAVRTVTAAGTVTVLASDGVIAINKTVPEATTVQLLPIASAPNVIIKDLAGNAATYPITITPSGAETVDGLASLTLNVGFSSVSLRPGAGGWVADLGYEGRGTLPVSRGGTGVAANTAFALLAGGSTGTGPVQSLSGLGTVGQVLTSNGAGALPTFQTAGGASILTPQARLTLTTNVPVLTSTVSAVTTVYYTPYAGNLVPIYNGTVWSALAISELSQATTDTTKSPAAVANNSNYDVFVWNDSGTMRATRGPAWTSDTARGTGAGTTELERVNGVLVNKIAITNGPAAQRGTYVGTIRSNGTATIDYILGGTAAGGQAAVLNVWNMYNRVNIVTAIRDSTDSWTLAASSIRSANNSATMRVSFVCGITEDTFSASYSCLAQAGASGAAGVAVGINSTSTPSGTFGYHNSSTFQTMVRGEAAGGFLGAGYFQALEMSQTAGTATFFGDAGVAYVQNALIGSLRM